MATSTQSSTQSPSPTQMDDAVKLMNDAGETASELYSKAGDWLSTNRKTVYMGAAFLAVGIVGFMIGRSVARDSNEVDSF